MDEEVDAETLAAELTRLVLEYEEGGADAEEAWNFIADFTVCNAEVICAALINSTK